MCNKHPTINRWFYRCLDCLTVCAADMDIPCGYGQVGCKCGVCGGDMESMGRVERDRMVKDATACACDARCTSATGPKCNCSCGGVNHGSNRVVKIILDQGPVPIMQAPDSDKARSVATEYREAIDTLRAERNAIADRKAAGWIPRPDFDRWQFLNTIISKAYTSRSHAGRMKTLRWAMTATA